MESPWKATVPVGDIVAGRYRGRRGLRDRSSLCTPQARREQPRSRADRFRPRRAISPVPLTTWRAHLPAHAGSTRSPPKPKPGLVDACPHPRPRIPTQRSNHAASTRPPNSSAHRPRRVASIGRDKQADRRNIQSFAPNFVMKTTPRAGAGPENADSGDRFGHRTMPGASACQNEILSVPREP